MKNTLKALLSVILVLTLLFAVSAPAFAADDVTPVIVISGMNAYPLTFEDGTTAFPMDTKVLLKDIPPIAGSAIATIGTGLDWKYFEKYGIPAIADMFSGFACDESGKSIENLTVETFPLSLGNYKEHFEECLSNQEGIAHQVADKIGWDNTWFMHYDWRMSPLCLADTLKEYVDNALAQTGAKKVSLVPMSFGGTIANAYIHKYGSEKIKNIVYASTAFNGVELVGKLFSGDPSITLYDTMVYMSAFAQNVPVITEILSLFAAVEEKTTTLPEKMIDGLVESLIKNLKTQVYSDIFGESLAHMKGLWCLMPHEYYESAKAYMSANCKFSSDFFDEIDLYMNNIQSKLPQTFADIHNKGTNVYITGAYGYAGIPVTTGCQRRTDTLIETYLMTGNATVADYGKTLADTTYTSGTTCSKHNHVSLDNICDASTAMLPEQTWIVGGIGHLKYDYNTTPSLLVTYLATSDEYQSVWSNSEYPQFIKYDKATETTVSNTADIQIAPQSSKVEEKWYGKILEVLSKGVSFVMKVLGLEAKS